MKFYILFIFTALILILSTEGKSQDISQYLKDGNRSESKNIISIGYDPLNGELPIKLEHWVVSRFAFEIGGGPVWLTKQNWLLPDDPLPIKQTGLGFSAFLKAKVYFSKFPERHYITIYPKINVMDHKVFVDAAILNLGYQRIIFNKILLGVEAGFGFRIYRDPSWIVIEGESDIIWSPHVPVSINLGYLF
jgi:hypothetical protein